MKVFTLLCGVLLAASASFAQECNTLFYTQFDDPGETKFMDHQQIFGDASDDGPIITIENGELNIAMQGHDSLGQVSLELNRDGSSYVAEVDYDSNDVFLFIRAKARVRMALRVTLLGENGATAQNNLLQLTTDADDGNDFPDSTTFDLILEREYQEFAIDFDEALWDEWSFILDVPARSIYCPAGGTNCGADGISSPLAKILFRPNPFFERFPVVIEDSTVFFNTDYKSDFTIDYVYLGAGSLDQVHNCVNPAVGISDRQKENLNLNVYPNPSSNIARVNLEKDNQKGIIEVFNLSGSKIEEFQYNDNTLDIDVSEYEPGAYIVKYANDDFAGVRRFVVE